MNDILLDLRLGEKSFDCLRKALQSIDTYGQDICHAAVLQAVQNRKPQLCAFVLANIHTENVLMTVHIYPDRDIDRTLYKPAFIPYMVIGRIHENDCIDFFQRPFLPFFYDGKDLYECYIIIPAILIFYATLSKNSQYPKFLALIHNPSVPSASIISLHSKAF